MMRITTEAELRALTKSGYIDGKSLKKDWIKWASAWHGLGPVYEWVTGLPSNNVTGRVMGDI